MSKMSDSKKRRDKRRSSKKQNRADNNDSNISITRSESRQSQHRLRSSSKQRKHRQESRKNYNEDERSSRNRKSDKNRNSRTSRHSRNSINSRNYSTRSDLSRTSDIHLYGGNISDMDNLSENYQKVVRKLVQDKHKLKTKLKKLIKEIEIRTMEHNDDLRHIEKHYKEQIRELSLEKDSLYKDIETISSDMNEERIQAREHFNKKLEQYKESLEIRYNTQEEQTKHLHKTIESLEERLQSQIEHSDTIKSSTEQFYTKKLKSMEKENKRLTNIVNQQRENSIREQNELESLKELYKQNTEQITEQITEQKNDEIKSILEDKNRALQSLQELQKQMKQQKLTDDDIRMKKIKKMEENVQFHKSQALQKIEKANELCELKIQEVESRLLEQSRVHKEIVSKLQYDWQREKENLERVYNSNVEQLKQINQKQLENIKEQQRATDISLANLKKQLTTEYERREIELKNKYNHSVKLLKEDLSTRLVKTEEELEKVKLSSIKATGELQEQKEELEQRIIMLKNNIQKMQANSEHLNNQFLLNMNKQKEMAKNEIMSRNSRIEELESYIRKISTEMEERMDTMYKKVTQSDEDVTDMKGRYNLIKKENDTLEQEAAKNRNTIRKFSEEIIQLKNRIALFQADIGINKKMLQEKEEEIRLIKEQFEKYKSYNSDHARLTEEHEYMFKRVNALENELVEKQKKIHEDYLINTKLNAEVQVYTAEREDMSNSIEEQQAQINKLQEELLTYQDSDVKSRKTIKLMEEKLRSLENRLKIDTRGNNVKVTELTESIDKLRKDHKKKIHELHNVNVRYKKKVEENHALEISKLRKEIDSQEKTILNLEKRLKEINEDENIEENEENVEKEEENKE